MSYLFWQSLLLLINLQIIYSIQLTIYQNMRWTNKIMHSNRDQNTSGLSSRSLSKFKKVKLQKSQAEISSNNDQLEKSQLKLNSVEKIKHSHFHKSCIANYIGLSSGKGNHQRSLMETNVVIKGFQLESLAQQGQKNIMPSQFHNEAIHNSDQQSKRFQHEFQGLGFFHKDTIISSKDSNPHAHHPQTIPQHSNTTQIQLHNILSKIHELFQNFKQTSLIIKSNLKQSALLAFETLHNNLKSSIDDFQNNLENGMNRLIELKNNQISSIDLQKIVENDINLCQKDGDQSLYKIKYLEHEEIYHHHDGKQKQETKNRPYSFKNKFKQIIVDSDQNVLMKRCGIQTKIAQQSNTIEQKQTKKLSRKRTIPTPRVNSQLDNDSSICNEESLQQLNSSMNSIKYLKLNQRNGSKSVKKLQQKIAVIKNVFKADNNKRQQEKGQTVREVTSKC